MLIVDSCITRFVGIDLHKHFAVVAAVDAQQQLVLKPTGRISLNDWPSWAASHLGPQDAVVVEATSNAWWCYDIVAPLVGCAVVANPLQVKGIAAAAVKTDKHDSEPWGVVAPFLIQLPGFALVSAMTVLAAIGDISRFPSAKHLVGYAGLGAGVHDSSQAHQDGSLTKQGRRDLRRVLIEAAWSAVTTHPHWKQEFVRLCRRKPEGVAIVAIAPKLLVVVWHGLSERAADRHADPVMVATKLMRWGWELTPEQRGGLTTRQFVRYGLMRLDLGHDLTGFHYGGQPRGLASEIEILARFPELAPSA